MAAGKEIRGKIKSVENTKKITKAMEMVAASKMRKAQERMRSARPYAEKVRNIAANLGKANPEYTHAFMKTNDVKAAGVIVVSTDKGLCGGLNTNVLRAVTQKLRDLQGAGSTVQTVAIGNKGLGFLNRIGAQVVSHVTQLGDTPHLERLIGPVKVLLDQYAQGKLSAVYISYTRFINTMRQEPVGGATAALVGREDGTGVQGRGRRARLGLHLRAGRADGDRRAAASLRRGAGVPGGGGEHGFGAVRAHGGHEGRDGQRRHPDR
jgi:ATP synthase F1 gamma subunit